MHTPSTPRTTLDAMMEVKAAPGLNGSAAPRVAALVVTWNRRDMAEGVLDALKRQTHPGARLDVVVIDNASTDGTLDALCRRFRPEVVVDNPTRLAHRPMFRPRPAGERLGNAPGFRSLTIVRNAENLGGCGGFNTGLAYVEHALQDDRADRAHGASGSNEESRPEFVWLVDDDVDLPPDALERLVEAMRTDERIGLVGSRTVDLRDRKTTLETTVYQEHATGIFADQPDALHPRRGEHDAWIATVGAGRGRRSFAGLRDVDIVSACSMLARWSAVERVGFWDHRYFIYCDDADWCLRFARAGYRVVLNLDAVVFHTPWHHKLTPSRLYYAQRNLLWTIRKTTPPPRLRPVLRLRTRAMARQSLVAGTSHRIAHGEVLRRALDDAMRNKGGRLDLATPASISLEDVARSMLRPRVGGLVVACVIHRPIAVEWGAGVRAALRGALPAQVSLRWFEFVRNDVPGAHDLASSAEVTRVVYAPHLKSRLRRQTPLLRSRADLLVEFDGAADLPLLRSPRWILHIDSARPGEGVLEPGGLLPRLAFLGRWARTAARARRWASTASPDDASGRFGGVGTRV